MEEDQEEVLEPEVVTEVEEEEEVAEEEEEDQEVEDSRMNGLHLPNLED